MFHSVYQEAIEYYSGLTQDVEHDLFNYEAQIHWDYEAYDIVQLVQFNLEDDMIKIRYAPHLIPDDPADEEKLMTTVHKDDVSRDAIGIEDRFVVL